jgi:hypothetical protein
MMNASRTAAKAGSGCECSHHLIAANSITASPRHTEGFHLRQSCDEQVGGQEECPAPDHATVTSLLR